MISEYKHQNQPSTMFSCEVQHTMLAGNVAPNYTGISKVNVNIIQQLVTGATWNANHHEMQTA